MLWSIRKILLNQKLELPLAQQEYIDLYRDVEISQDLYSELVNRKLGFSIMEASTIGNIRVVDEAYQDFMVSPKPFMLIFSVFFTFLLLFLLLLSGVYIFSQSLIRLKYKIATLMRQLLGLPHMLNSWMNQMKDSFSH